MVRRRLDDTSKVPLNMIYGHALWPGLGILYSDLCFPPSVGVIETAFTQQRLQMLTPS